jgi:hypothetical protein
VSKVPTKAVEYGDPEVVARRVLDTVRDGWTALEAAPALAARAVAGGSAATPTPAAAPAKAAEGAGDGEHEDDDEDEDEDQDSPRLTLLRARHATGACVPRHTLHTMPYPRDRKGRYTHAHTHSQRER